MSDMLTRMAERTMGLLPSLQPKLTSLFEPSQILGDEIFSSFSEPMGVSSTSLATEAIDPVGVNSASMHQQNLQHPLVSSKQQNLPISRLSHNLSGSSFLPSPSQESNLNSLPTTDEEDLHISSSADNFSLSQSAAPEINLTREPSELTSELTPFNLPIQSPQESTQRSPESFLNPLTLTANPTTEAESINYSPTSIPDRMSQMSEKRLENPVANIQALSPYPDLSSIGDQQNEIELQSPRSSTEKSNVVSQPPIANPANTEGLTQPLVTNERPLGQTVQSLVPVTVRQIDRIVDAPSRGLQHQQDLATSSPAPPTIQVKIGRIEIRAVTNPPPPQRSRSTAPLPKMSLEDYLKSRGEG